MNELIAILDELLVAYEAAAPEIDQDLVDRTLEVREKAKNHYRTLKGAFLGIVRGIGAGIVLLMLALPARAYDTKDNPDRYLSVGLDVSSGHLAGILKDTSKLPADSPQTDGGFVKGALDVRVPISNAVTFHAFGSSTGINNNLQYSEGSEVGVGLRVYIH